MPSAIPPAVRRHHPWRVTSIVAGALFGGLLIALAGVTPFRSETARVEVMAQLADRLDADVGIGDLKLRILPWFRAEGHNLTVRAKGRPALPPLISVGHFSAESSLFALLRRHISSVAVERFEIQVSPRRDRRDGASAFSASATSTTAVDDPRASARFENTFIIDELISKDGKLALIPRVAGKRVKVWGITDLRMTSVSVDGAMPFTATLANDRPPGDIEVSGSFGPWRSEDPDLTPLAGVFTFARADLSVFNGISGILSSRGTFGGALGRIDIHGDTETPDFMVKVGAHPMPLRTSYHAIVDGTNGDTILDDIRASFLQSRLVAKGAVIGTPGVRGRTVTLYIDMSDARIEDILSLAVDTPTPPMTGALRLRTTFVLPPGERDVAEKLELDGTFVIADTRFTDAGVQKKINSLSHRTRGKSPDERIIQVSSQFAGKFTLSDSQVTIGHVTFDVPGSAIRLSGTYGLMSEDVAFAGMVYTDAKISQMTTGLKSLLLKPVDLLFRSKRGGAAIPIRIGGKRGNPSFGLDKGRVFKR